MQQLPIDLFHAQADRTHHQRQSDHRAGQYRALPAENQFDAQGFEDVAEGSPAPEQQEQQVADHHRRQDQGQIDQAVEQGLAAQATEGQYPGQAEADRKIDQGGRCRDFGGQPDCLNIGRGQGQHGL